MNAPNNNSVSHEELRKRAVRWLTVTKRCGVVLSEIVTACSEIPDAVGWHGHCSYSVECKVSRADFLRNGDKIYSRAGRGVGYYRYFLVPRGLVQPGDLADIGPDGVKPWDYGLLWYYSEGSGIIKVVKEPLPREPCREDEITMLVSALRRVRAREFIVLMQEGVEN